MGAQDQLPGEADDDEGEHGRQEEDRSVERAAAQFRDGQERGQRDADRVLQQQVEDEEVDVVPQRLPKVDRPIRIAEQGGKVGEAHEGRDVVDLAEEREPERIGERHDHQGRVDEEGRQQEHEDVPPPGAARRRVAQRCRKRRGVGRDVLDLGHAQVSPFSRANGRRWPRIAGSDEGGFGAGSGPFRAALALIRHGLRRDTFSRSRGRREARELTSPACTRRRGPSAAWRRPAQACRCR